MRRQKRKITGLLALAAALSLTACSGKTTETEMETQSESTTEAEFAGTIDVQKDWKAAFETVLLKERGVKPDHYEELGSGIYQVYVEKDGKVIPYAIVDSSTGEYHG
mgnify:FL=1